MHRLFFAPSSAAASFLPLRRPLAEASAVVGLLSMAEKAEMRGRGGWRGRNSYTLHRRPSHGLGRFCVSSIERRARKHADRAFDTGGARRQGALDIGETAGEACGRGTGPW